MKPKRHKGSNTFKFQTFAERISNIDIDVFHKVKHPFEEDDDDEECTYYSQCYFKWKNINFSQNYVDLFEKLPNDVHSLAHLITQKDQIINVLIDHIKCCDMNTLEPALELITAIAKDLRKEFYPYFNPTILREFVRMLDTKEPDQIEWVFMCLAHLFKYLWMKIIKNIDSVLPELLPLLSNSKPIYINNFAAESFAFVARKVRDKSQFLTLSLENIKNNPSELMGMAKLFFEVVKSVGEQFHSGAADFLVILLRSINVRKYSELLYSILEHICKYLITFITKKTDVSPLWNSFLKVTNEFLCEWQKDQNHHSCENLIMLLKLIERFIVTKNIILRDPTDIINISLKLALDPNIIDEKELQAVVLDIIAHVLINQHTSIMVKNIDSIIIKVLNHVHDTELQIRFIEKIIDVQKYELLTFSTFLKFVNTVGLNDVLIQFFTKIIYKKTKFLLDDKTDENLTFFAVGLESVCESFSQYLLNVIPEDLSQNVIESCEKISCSILILCYCCKSHSVFLCKIDRFIAILSDSLHNITTVEHTAKILFILLIITQYRMKYFSSTPFDYQSLFKLTVKYIASCNYLCSLRLLEILSPLTTEIFDENLQLCVINNLSSPFHKVRLFSSSVLNKMNIHSIFQYMFIIESIEPTIETYRDKLQKLQKFEYNELLANNIEKKLLRTAVVKFLFGTLYISFQYLWEPVQQLIISHLENDSTVWEIFENQLNTAIENDLNSVKLLENFMVSFECEFFQKHFYDLNGVDDRLDFFNFRCLLMEVLTNVKKYSFTHNNFMPELFLNFYHSEYSTSNSKFNSLCNVKKKGKNEDPSNKETENDIDTNSSSIDSAQTKNFNKLLILHLKIINKLQITEQTFKSKIFDVYFDLLANGNSEIQQLAIQYVCSRKGLNIYKDRLLLLTKDNTFKEELMNIRIDLNADNFIRQHKSNFMRVMLKIMYGKLRKKSSHLRDSMFEFLSECEENEIFLFFDMIFKQIITMKTDSIVDTLACGEHIDLERCISLHCFSAYINTVIDLFKRCRKLLKTSVLSYLLNIVLIIIANLNAMLQRKDEIYGGYHGLLSKIRIACFEAIIYFFENFEYYSWTEEEIRVVLKLFIEPRIEKVPEECLQSMNPVMKLFIVFTKNPRYYPLLTIKFGNIAATDVIMNLLNNEKAYFNVKNSVIEIIERLLTIEDDHDQDDNSKVSDLIHLDTISKKPIENNRQYGMVLLMPYISTILEYLQKSLAKKYIKLNAVYMLILKKMCDFGLNEEDSIALLNLLMPILRNKATSDEENLMPLLDTIVNLFKTVKTYSYFENYLLQIAYLFGITSASSVRKILCDLLRYISQKTGNTYINVELITGLNLYDKRWIDQPDYSGRLETFKKINESIANDEISLYTAVFIVYNCFFMIRVEKDIALRDHSGLCLQKLCVTLCKKFSSTSSKELNTLLNTIVLPLIKEGILSNNENYQQESVVLFGHLVRECNEIHSVFKNLHALSDKDNMENDFFENIQHLQNHKKIKALKRFCEVMSVEKKAPLPNSLSFVSPLITQYLLSTKHATEHALINCCVDALKVICRLSPWRSYERILRKYILEMRKNITLRKQAIRIVSIILDSFHFDLSQADITGKKMTTKQNDMKETNENNKDELINDDTMTDDTHMDIDNDASDNDNSENSSDSDSDDKNENKDTNKNSVRSSLTAVEKVHVLCPSDAIRVYRSIKSFLIPSLNRIFMMYDDSEQYHKLSKHEMKNEKEEMAVLSIPIAFAIVKLLKRLPGGILDEYVSTVFLKLSTYLKSRLISIRLVARETMQNILIEIGPKYLPKLLLEMISILNKGFQIHVLVFTCNAILDKIRTLFQQGDADLCVKSVLKICLRDLFGDLSEEKEIAKISSKTPEAKGNKSYNMLNLLAEYVSESRMLDLVLPFKEIISNNLSSKIVTKVRKCLQYIALGLTRNQFIDVESLLIFTYRVSNECIPVLTDEIQNKKRTADEAVPKKADCFLLSEEPRHMKSETRRSCTRTNAHTIIEFGLELLEQMLKREVLRQSKYRSYLDPFVPLIKDCLQSQHIKLTITSLKCLIYLLRRDLPSLNENVNEISESIFTMLGKNSCSSATGENAVMLMAATKVALVLIRDLKHTINNDQLRILIYVCEDLQNNVSHYATGFSLLRAIIGRKYNIPEVHELMRKTTEISIRSYSDSIRTMARKAFYQYLMDYPFNKQLRNFVMFYVAQCEYDELTGRKSALEMISVLIKVFPLENLLEFSSVLFVKLSFRLIKDESPECKKVVADCITCIISRLKKSKEQGVLLDCTMAWLNQKHITHRRLAVQLLELFIVADKENFFSKLKDLLQILENYLTDDVTNNLKSQQSINAEVIIAGKDHFLFQLLQLYKVVLESYPILLSDLSYSNHITKLAERCQLYLRYPHEWVRLGAIQVLNIICNSIDISEITSSVLYNGKEISNSLYLRNNQSKMQIKSLCLDLYDQLAPGHDVTADILHHTMKMFLFLADILKYVTCTKDKNELSLIWLIRRLVKQVNAEVSLTPQKYSVRIIVFNWFSSLIDKLEQDKIESVLLNVMKPLIRELSTQDKTGENIRQVAKEVLKQYRQKVKKNYYDETFVKIQRILDVKRSKRKTLLAQMAIVDPERAAKRRIKVQQKKKEQKKRKLEKLRKKKIKIKKKKQIEIKID